MRFCTVLNYQICMCVIHVHFLPKNVSKDMQNHIQNEQPSSQQRLLGVMLAAGSQQPLLGVKLAASSRCWVSTWQPAAQGLQVELDAILRPLSNQTSMRFSAERGV